MRWSRSAGAALAAGVLVAVLAGCTGGAGADGAGTSSASSSSSSASGADPVPATVKVNPRDKTEGVMPDDTVTVQVLKGDLQKVTVTDEKGAEVPGKVDGHTWTSTGRMRPSARYAVTVDAAGPDGSPSTQKSTFRTHRPEVTATYGVVYSGETVGVAMPVSIQFDSEVTDPAYRKAVEQAVSVKTTPQTEGSWGWLDNRQLMWRPKDYWQPGTKVTVDAPLAGFQTGPDKWVGEDVTGSMTIGRRQVLNVDIDKHRMTVVRGGKTVKTFPVSSGKPGPETETRSGTKVVIGKVREMTMDSATVGIEKGEPGYYNVDTDWNLRVTWTGEFFHSAPWSVGSQGSSNVSHGCINLAPENARWLY